MTSFKYNVINTNTNRKVGKTSFPTYEKARQFARKQIRKSSTDPLLSHWRGYTSNPAMFDGDYAIRKVKA